MMINIPYGSLALIGLVGSHGLPTPIAFTAETLNWYSVFSYKSGIVNIVSGIGFLLAFTQRVPGNWQRSNTYPVIGEPPSFCGTSQVKVTLDLVTSVA